jgi:hypothetical protein
MDGGSRGRPSESPVLRGRAASVADERRSLDQRAWLQNHAPDLYEQWRAAPSPCARDRVAQRMEQRLEELGVSQKTTIDRIVTELAEAESWEKLAQRAGRRLA